MRSHALAFLAAVGLWLGGALSAPAADAKKAPEEKPFPEPGSWVPNSFSPLIVNGGWKDMKGNPAARHHSVVDAFGLKPVVMVFARDPKDEAVFEFLRKLDAKVEEHKEVDLCGCAIFLAYDGKRDKSDLTPEDLIAIANERESLVKTLRDKCQGLKHVLVGLDSPNGPKGFKVGKDTYVLVVLYDKFRVAGSHSYEIGDKENKEAGFGPKAQEQLLKEIDAWTARLKRKPGSVKKAEK